MNWTVKLADTANSQTTKGALVVCLPDVLVDQEAFALRLGEETVTATWHRAMGVLVLRDANGVERNIRLRSRSVERYDGDAALRIAGELQTSGAHSVHGLAASVEPHVPGQEARGGAKAQRDTVVRSQITGKVLKVLVAPGQTVAAGDTLLVVEAMKMENRVFAQAPGIVTAVAVKDGDAVATGKELARLSPLGAESAG
jgi:biotin carboxyl carrier protein